MLSNMDLINEPEPFRNKPFVGEFITTKPLSAAMGGEILDIQLRQLTPEAFLELKTALYHHKMIFIRGQELSLQDQESITLNFGEFGTDAYSTGMPGHPDIQPVIKEASTKSKMIFGGGWHTDSPFLVEPPSISILNGVEIPPYGGDTIWYNAVLAYESLSEIMKNLLKDLKVHMSAKNVVDALHRLGSASQKTTKMSDMELELDIKSMVEGSFHPMVRRHPHSDEVSLYCDSVYSIGIKGMTSHECKPLLDFIVSHTTQEQFSCRLRWEPNTVAIWDNRVCLHRAFNDYNGFRREMHRTTVKGEVPVSAF